MKGSLDSHHHHHHHHQDSLKRKWAQENRLFLSVDHNNNNQRRQYNSSGFFTRFAGATPPKNNNLLGGLETDDLVSAVVPQITVVLEGRSICQRINLHKHSSYHSLARALRDMFAVDSADHHQGHQDQEEEEEVEGYQEEASQDHEIALSNAIPGHLVAYEDMEDDLLLVGDLNWKDFVRVAKRIRIVPLKPNSRIKGRAGAD